MRDDIIEQLEKTVMQILIGRINAASVAKREIDFLNKKRDALRKQGIIAPSASWQVKHE